MNDDSRPYTHPLFDFTMNVPGLNVGMTAVDKLFTWGLSSSLWVFPMATSCCGIELMAAAASRVDLDRMGTIVRGTPRQADVMVVAGTITVKMAPRVKRLWDQMPEPKWCIAMGSCAMSGDFYRDLYPTVPGIDTFLPVDVYVPGCPPGPEALMHGLMRLQEKVRARRAGQKTTPEVRPPDAADLLVRTRPAIGRMGDAGRDPKTGAAQLQAAMDTYAGPAPDGEVIASDTIATNGVAAAVPPDANVEALLKDHFGVAELPKDGPPVIDRGQHVALARALKAMGYRQLVFVVATHFLPPKPKAPAAGEEAPPPAPETFELAYGVRTIGAGSRVFSWRVRIETTQSIDTLFPVYAGADWQEREQYDLLGVKFAGHPDLRRILLPEDWRGYPLRRDYPSDAPCAPWR